MTHRSPLAARLLAFILLLLASSAAAQVTPQSEPARGGFIRGQLVDAAGAPISDALVVLADSAGRRRSASLTDAQGRFTLAVPEAGEYRLRSERVGYVSAVTEPVRVAEGQTLEYRMETRVAAVALDEVAVHARARCEVRPDASLGTSVLWEEVRKALSAAEWAREEGLFTFQVRHWERDLDRVARRIDREETRTLAMNVHNPFRSAPPAELHARGWVRQEGPDRVFFAPDAGALLAEEFLDTHCFRAVRHPRDTVLIGLAFEPVRGRRVPDVSGTLWVDRQTSALRELEYVYTGIEAQGEDGAGPAGGKLQFQRVPGGAWIVRRWSIQTPLLRVQNDENALDRRRVLMLRDAGAEVMEVRGRDGQVTRLSYTGAVEGVVFDSTRARPLADARVVVVGTEYAAVTDSGGAFRLEVPTGNWAVSFSHPRLEELGYAPEPVGAYVREDTATRVALAVPSNERLVAALCADSAQGVLFGTVHSLASEVALPGAHVTVSWRDPDARRGEKAELETDEYGRFLFCTLPADLPLRVTGEFVSVALPPASVTLQSGVPRQLGMAVPLRSGVGAEEARPVALSGRIRRHDGSAAPAGVVVRLRPATQGSDPGRLRQERTTGRGRFSFGLVPPGEYQVEVEASGRRTVQRLVLSGVGGGVEVELTLGAENAVLLDPVVATARPSERMENGRLLVTRAHLEQRMESAPSVLELLDLFPEVVVERWCVGLRVQMNMYNRYRRLQSNAPRCTFMNVYIDGNLVELPPRDIIRMLRTMRLDEIEELEVLTESASGTRFPQTPSRGVVSIRTRSGAAEGARQP